jgi:Dehydrogenases with different specificities (related to short-chain alcohol dehydrogenases)
MKPKVEFMSLTNKVVLITGAGTGIGADAACAFHLAGGKLVLNGRRETELEKTASLLDPTGRSVAIVAGDIGDPATSKRMVDVALRRFGGVDVLFNNAGIFTPRPFLEVTPEHLEGYLNLVRGYYFASQAVIPEMQRRGGGAIINTGSMWANHAVAATPCSASSTAKGGVHALTRNLAIEFAPHRIRVNAIAPAVVETPLLEPTFTAEQVESFNAFHPLGRNGQPRDITEAALFFADEERSGWITGVVLPVDGGVTAGRN